MIANFETGLKVCSNKNCVFKGQGQLLSNFGKRKSSPDGLEFRCKNCINANEFNKRRKLGQKIQIGRIADFETGLKICSKCGQEKSLDNFNKNKCLSDGLDNNCKYCVHLIYLAHKQERLDKQIQYKKLHKQEIGIYQQAYRDTHKSESVEYRKITRKRETNRHLKKLKYDPMYKLKTVLRIRLNIALADKRWTKNNHFYGYIGCTLSELKLHLESQFQSGMTWGNHGKGFGKWNIDHIIPLSSAKTPEAMYKLCHYTNLQPLWELENLSKSAKIL